MAKEIESTNKADDPSNRETNASVQWEEMVGQAKEVLNRKITKDPNLDLGIKGKSNEAIGQLKKMRVHEKCK